MCSRLPFHLGTALPIQVLLLYSSRVCYCPHFNSYLAQLALLTYTHEKPAVMKHLPLALCTNMVLFQLTGLKLCTLLCSGALVANYIPRRF